MPSLSPLLDPCLQWLRSALQARRFDQALTARIARVHREATGLPGTLVDCLTRIAQREGATPRVKGAPDTVGLLRPRALQALATLKMGDGGREAQRTLLELTRWMVSADARDEDTFHAYGLAFVHVHADVMRALAQHLKPKVVMHMTCVPRIDRAQQSVASFERLPADEYSQISVVGSGADSVVFEWDPHGQVLRVPCSDAYDHLASKVSAAYFMLGMLPGRRVVMKVDDDHRLADASALRRAFERALRTTHARQWGHLYYCPLPAGHSRVWHIGKCGTAPINDVPYTHMGALRWCTGEHGYLLSHAALLRFVWAQFYYGAHTHSALYEDAYVSDMLLRLGGSIRVLPMKRLLAATSAY